MMTFVKANTGITSESRIKGPCQEGLSVCHRPASRAGKLLRTVNVILYIHIFCSNGRNREEVGSLIGGFKFVM